jgi:hypothetical protein
MLQGNKIVVPRHMPLAPEILRCLHNSYHLPGLATSALEHGLARPPGSSSYLRTGRAVDA